MEVLFNQMQNAAITLVSPMNQMYLQSGNFSL